MELIRKQTILNMLDDMQFERYHTHAELELMARIYHVVNDLDSVDAVEVVRCKECKHFELNHFEKIDGQPIIVAHEICSKWGNGCKTDRNGYCFMGERKTDG